MTNFHPTPQRETLVFPINVVKHRFQKRMAGLIFLLYLTILMMLFYVISGCSASPPHRLPTHYQTEPQASQILQGKLSGSTHGRLPIGLAIVVHGESSHGPPALNDENWPQFAARVKQTVQGVMPLTMQEVIRIEDVPTGEKAPLVQGLGGNPPLEVVLVVLSSSQEARGPAQYDVLPEVSMLPGYQTENHATVELGLLDLSSGKLLLQSQGTSYAILDQLDVPLASNRYPRVRGSAMTTPTYPENGKALETLRIIALYEALDQAAMKLAQQWPEGKGGSSPSTSPRTGADS
ncbi:MAG: hypothetical protein AB7P17_12915 [Nitrospirales bacterium]|nr:hypothetical protein [Nitrospirales bacterium]